MNYILYAIDALTLLYLIYIAVYDIKKHLILDKALLWFTPVALARVVFACICEVQAGSTVGSEIMSHLLGGIIPFAVFLLIACVRGGLGGGDIKLVGLLGFMAGLTDIIIGLGCGFAAAAIICGIIGVFYGFRKVWFAIGPYIALGYGAAIILDHTGFLNLILSYLT